MRMNVGERKLPVDDADLLGVRLFHLLQSRKEPAAIRTFEIRKLDNRYRSIRRPSRRKAGSRDLSSKRFQIRFESKILLQTRQQHVLVSCAASLDEILLHLWKSLFLWYRNTIFVRIVECFHF